MRIPFRWFSAVLAVQALAVPVSALAASGGGFVLRAVVPVVCRLTQTAAGDGTARVEEFCNSPRGYRVFARHAPEAAADGLTFEYGGQIVPAEPDGETLLLDAPRAARVSRDLRILPGGGPALAVSLLIEPK